jgi:hypothetical protein
MRTVRNVIIGFVLILLLWDPLRLTPPGPFTYEVTADVRNKLDKENFLTLPESVTDQLRAAENLFYKDEAMVSAAVERALDGEHNKDHIAAVLKGSAVRLPDAVILKESGRSPKEVCDELINTLQKNGERPAVAVWRDRYINREFYGPLGTRKKISDVVSEHLALFKEKGIAILPDGAFPPGAVSEPLYAVPDSLKVVATNQPGLITLALKTPWTKETLLRQAQGLALVAETFRLLVHLLLYLGLLFGVGAIYRKFAFSARGSAVELGLAQSPWWFRWRRFQVRVQRFLDRFQSPRSKFILSVSLLLAGVVLVGFGLFSFLRDPESVLRHGVPIGLILILLVPTDGILKGAWAPRLKIAHGTLLQVGGLYALVGLFLLFFSDDWGPGLLLSQKRSVLALVGIGLLLLGKRKRELKAEESLALQPNRAPVLHLRSFETEKQKLKETWISWLKRFLRPNDEQLLRPIFSELGPFATFTNIEEQAQAGTVTTAGAIPGDSLSPAHELIRRSALVILQVDNRLTQNSLSQIRQTIQILKPNQVLVYFSQNIEATKLNEVYQKFVNQTRDVFSSVLPPSIDSSRFLAFDDDWQPFLCRSVTMSKFSLGKFMPLLGHRLEATRRSRAFARALRPFFERRNLVNSQKKLYGDRAIGVSAFILFNLGLPAGVMMLRNLWLMRRRWVAPIALFAPSIVIVVSCIVGYVLMGIFDYLGFLLEGVAFLIVFFFGSPITTYWLWRRLSGREIRQHIAFGGDTQPLWKVILVLLLSGGWMLGAFVFLVIGL